MNVLKLACGVTVTGWLVAGGCGGDEQSDDNIFAGSTTTTTSSRSASTGSGTGGTGGSTTVGNGGSADTCGDFTCSAAECASDSCAPDCGAPPCMSTCGDDVCDGNAGEACDTCPADCQRGCGDGCCLIGEDCMSCPADCATVEGCDPTACGNNQCNYGLSETCLNCADCFGLCGCGDNQCVAPETTANCPWDC